MGKKYLGFVLLVFAISCVDPYEFKIIDNEPALVVEGIISDKSFNETLAYPSDGRFFSIKLTKTGDVANERPQPLRDALVQLVTNDDRTFNYLESSPGVYVLQEPDFKAEPEIAYKLMITTGEDIFESEWEELPALAGPEVGNITFVEEQRPTFVVEAGESVIRSKKGIGTFVDVPENVTGRPIHYRWSFEPTWIYRAPLSSSSDAGHICWVKGKNYLTDLILQLDNAGGYKKDLFFIETIRNERIFEMFSVLFLQYILNEDYYFFLKEMKDQVESGGITGKPPFNLKTNLKSTSGKKKVIGYFAVINEQAKRWYFDKSKLSYNVVNPLKDDCLVDYGGGGPAPECVDCRTYYLGTPSTQRPDWWLK